MRLSDYDSIVFDLDDTLYLERDYIASGFRAVGRFLEQEYQWPQWSARGFVATCWQTLQAGQRGAIFNLALERIASRLPTPPIETLVRAYREHRPMISLLPDSHCLLEEFRDHPGLWIITDGPIVSQRAKVTALGIASRVRRVVYTDQWGRAYWKPHSRAFELVQYEMAADGRKCIYVADNPAKDFRSPRRLGWATVRVRRPNSLHFNRQPESGAEADWECASLWPLCGSVIGQSRGKAA